MDHRFLGAAVGVAFFGSLTADVLAANLVLNGSFERPVVASGFLLFNTGSTAIPRWKVVGAAGDTAIVSGSFSQNGYNFPAKSGANWVDLTGRSNTATGVEQTVRTEVGKQYRLTFFVGNVVNPTGIFGTVSTVDVLIDDAQVFSAVNRRLTGSTVQNWKKFAFTFTAEFTKTKIAFINDDPGSDTSNGLDAVNLVLIP